ncbi:hypothetical protein CkaCkLH20_07922 [Colletotrichum karsti]|uniref:LysM domain-containing protein n=1 Tax=Colletotrichum karsti TaxID=1095194 RepID=A0A9P6LJF0_9PEZI|nr:uncharacterized protein CkaCkLH20_07922 [Colletotrichum karsti]KAF9874785.1 hypothetical protein CkaCkLH20_07922 [Colletotrichum karsti]
MSSLFYKLLLVAGLAQAAFGRAGRAGVVRRDGPTPSLDYDPNTTEYCSWWADITSATSCSSLLSNNFISLEEFRRWNPSITADCSVQVGKSYCVETTNEPPPSTSTSSSRSASATSTRPPSVTSTTTTSAPPTTTKPPNGTETPSPTQPQIVTNCDAFYFVKQGDTCDAIIKAHGITLAQFLSWNPSAGSSCTGLWAEAYACVSIIGHEPSIPSTTTTAGNGIATPTPTLPDMVTNCDSFYMVKSGDTCAAIASKSGITTAQILSWNPNVGSSCSGLWLDYVSNAFA